jgi:hypothetical protein
VEVNTIEVVCEDPHHTRGKVAKVQTFAYYAATDSWVDVAYRGRGQAHQHPGEYPTPFRPNVIGARPPLRHRYECTLCAGKPWSTPLACTDTTLQWLLNTVAAQDVTHISLHTLSAIASRRSKQ